VEVGWREALEFVEPGSSAPSAEDLTHNRGLTPGIWAVTSRGRRMVLKYILSHLRSPALACRKTGIHA
jgi:hypothetical protein